VIFFAYIGFDAVSTGSEEARTQTRPAARDLRLAAICTVIYILVAIDRDRRARRDRAREVRRAAGRPRSTGRGCRGQGAVIAFGALVAITSVVLTILYGQTRIMFAMCRDGLMPARLAEVNPRTGTPARLTLIFGLLIAVLAALVPLTGDHQAGQRRHAVRLHLVNIGVVILRRTNPGMERPFRVPFSPVFPIIGVGLCIYLMTKLPGETWVRFVFWLLVGFVIYYFYGRKHSRLRTGAAPPKETELPPGETL
jgi:APA family basic amino acid/polyamine antiporter